MSDHPPLVEVKFSLLNDFTILHHLPGGIDLLICAEAVL